MTVVRTTRTIQFFTPAIAALVVVLAACPPARPVQPGQAMPAGGHNLLEEENRELRAEIERLRTALVGQAQWTGTIQTQRVGGAGGLPFARMCPAGHAITGMRGGSGSLIDSIYPICSNMQGAPEVPSGFVLSELPLPRIGGMGGIPYERLCPAGTVVAGARGRADEGFVQQLSLVCAAPTSRNADSPEPDDEGDTTDQPDTDGGDESGLQPTRRRRRGGRTTLPAIATSTAGSPFRVNCPRDYAVVGLTGGAGRLIDGMAFVCGPLSHAALEPESDTE